MLVTSLNVRFYVFFREEKNKTRNNKRDKID